MEILGHNFIYRKIRDAIKRKDYSYYPLKNEMIKKIIKDDIPNKKQFFEKRLNEGELGTILLSIRKQCNSFNLESADPILDKDITELFFDIPGEQLLLNGVKRSLIKGSMKNLVPIEIINRSDKMPFSPDYNIRIAQIQQENLKRLIDKGWGTDAAGIDYDKLVSIISKIDQSAIKTEWNINNELFYIPFIIIAGEFAGWIDKKLCFTGV